MITDEQRDNLLVLYHNENMLKKEIRSYEVSLWTLQDEFITVLKWSDAEHKGRIDKPIMTLNIDGTQTFTCDIPMYIHRDGKLVENPNWYTTRNGNIILDLRKIKIILNKKTADEGVYEFIIDKVKDSHESEILTCSIECSGLAFHELGKIGYKIALSLAVFEDDYEAWEKRDTSDTSSAPMATLDYWMSKVGIPILIAQPISTLWYYDVQMNWKSFSSLVSGARSNKKIYEEPYTSSWDSNLLPLTTENAREKERQIEAENSNIYNITLTIAETFGVFCCYEYGYDDNYHITSRTIVFYNNFITDNTNPLSLTYPYSSTRVSRERDSTDLTTKLYVLSIDNSENVEGYNSIMNAEANATHEDYILNFDYLYDTGAITLEQYDAISVYEKAMREKNEALIPIQNAIALYESKLVDAEASKTVYSNSISLDLEQISTNNSLKNALEAKYSGENVTGITLTTANPDSGHILSDEVGNYVSLDYTNKGILVDTLHVYRTYNTSSKQLSSEINGYTIEYNEYGLPSKIRNIAPDGTNTKVWMIYTYDPLLYYDVVIKTWTVKLDSDTTALAKVEAELSEIATKLNAYRTLRDTLVALKTALMAEFERTMGPALREGYWQPDDYSDFGSHLSFSEALTSSVTTSSTEDVHLIWDTVLFDDELDIKYLLGVPATDVYYPCVNLSGCWSTLKDALNGSNASQISFIFNNSSDGITTNEIQYLLNFVIGSQAVIRFVKLGSTVYPALILLGAKGFSQDQLDLLADLTKSRPKIGYYTTSTSGNNVTVSVLSIQELNNASWWTFGGSSISSCDIVYPRISIKSLDFKPNDCAIRYNNVLLEQYYDYYTKTRLNEDTAQLQYYLTIKPEAIFKNGVFNNNVDMNYTISTANTLIYLDALEVSKENARPKVSYEVEPNILNRSITRVLYLKLAHLVMINDSELKFLDTFGYISQVTLDLATPDNDSIEVKNYTSKFEDLFSTIIALTEAMKSREHSFISAAAGETALTSEALTSTLISGENMSILNAYFDSYFDSSDVVREKLESLFSEAANILTDSSNTLNRAQVLSTENAAILSSFSLKIKDELSVLVFNLSTRPTTFKVGDIWIKSNDERYVAVYNSTDIMGDAEVGSGTSGWVRTYDGTLASITGAGLNIDAVAGTIDIEAANTIDIKSGNTVSIRANSTVEIYGQDSVNISGTTINITSETKNGTAYSASGINLIAAAYNTTNVNDNSIAKVLISPTRILMGAATLTMKAASTIEMLASSGTAANTATIKLDANDGIWIGSGKKVSIFSGTNTSGTNIEITPEHLFAGVTTGSNAAALEMKANYLIMAVGTNSSNFASSNVDIVASNSITGMKLTKDSFGLSIGSGNNRAVILANENGIIIGKGNTPTIDGSYVSISGTRVEIGSSGDLYVNMNNFKLQTDTTNGTRFAVGSNLNNITSVSSVDSSSAWVGLIYNTNGLFINGSVYASSFIASCTNGYFKATGANLGFYSASDSTTAIMTVSSSGITVASGFGLTVGGNFSLSANNVVINTAESTTGNKIFYIANNATWSSATAGIQYLAGGTLDIKGNVNAVAFTASSGFTATGTNAKFVADGAKFGFYTTTTPDTLILSFSYDANNNGILSVGSNFKLDIAGKLNMSSTNFLVNSEAIYEAASASNNYTETDELVFRVGGATGSRLSFYASGKLLISLGAGASITIGGTGAGESGMSYTGGNLVVKGTIYAVDGSFSGSITCGTGFSVTSAGSMTCIMGSIGGWTICTNGLIKGNLAITENVIDFNASSSSGLISFTSIMPNTLVSLHTLLTTDGIATANLRAATCTFGTVTASSLSGDLSLYNSSNDTTVTLTGVKMTKLDTILGWYDNVSTSVLGNRFVNLGDLSSYVTASALTYNVNESHTSFPSAATGLYCRELDMNGYVLTSSDIDTLHTIIQERNQGNVPG